MPLRAKKAEESTKKRLKLFLFGGPGVGKTTAAIAFPKSYVIDAERGCEHYAKKLAASDSVLFQSNDLDEVITEVRALKQERHQYRTVVIDPLTTLEADLIEKAENQFGAGDQRVWSHRDKVLRRLYNLLLSLDMNVILTAHVKDKYADAEGKERFKKVGTVHDGWRRIPYAFDLSLELEKRGKKRVAMIRKTRLEENGFLDGEEFEFSYEEVARRFGVDLLSREATPVGLATAEQCSALRDLIAAVKLEDGLVEKWLQKAQAECFEDMPATAVAACITFVQSKVPGVKTPNGNSEEKAS